MKFLCTKSEGECWQVAEYRLTDHEPTDEHYFVLNVDVLAQAHQFHSVLLRNDMRWDVEGRRWEKQPEGRFQEALHYAERQRVECPRCFQTYQRHGIHICSHNHTAFDHCRIYK